MTCPHMVFFLANSLTVGENGKVAIKSDFRLGAKIQVNRTTSGHISGELRKKILKNPPGNFTFETSS